MAKIRILSDRVANQIAAGEVIERPAAVVKELVENAIDAGATRVEVEFRHGGRSLMRIEDNGSGMSRDDALLALERHATSKITEADDLNRLASFGFRGEALPSIASVSRFELQTREASADVGTEILVNGGKFVHVRDCGRPVGTRMEVTQLFNSVPARRKFLKSDATESAHIIAVVRLYALSFPRVAFTLIEEGRTVFRSPECTTLAERIEGIFGRQISDGLVAIESTEPGMRLTGLIGAPGQGRPTRHEMITFVNQRPVDSRTLNYALIESYHETLPKGRYPAAFVFLDIDPAAVDVNVHPAKREVRFRSEAAVRSFVIRTVLARLRELRPGGITPQQAEPPPQENVGPDLGQAGATSKSPATSNRLDQGRALQGTRFTPPAQPLPAPSHVAPAFVPRPTFAPSAKPALAPSLPAQNPLRGWRYLGLSHEQYAHFETPSGLVLLDRRAAQERIWYERLLADFAAGQVACQQLLLPVPLEVDPIASVMLLDRLEFLHGHGFALAEFGRGFFRIEGVPSWMEPADAEPFVRELLGALRDGRLPENNLVVAREQLARLALTRAVRLPANESAEHMHALIAQLFACQSPHTSPSGKATYVELSHGELTRRFLR